MKIKFKILHYEYRFNLSPYIRLKFPNKQLVEFREKREVVIVATQNMVIQIHDDLRGVNK